MRPRVATQPQEGGSGSPQILKKRLYLVASGSIENEFNVILMMKHEIQDFVINLILYKNWKQKL